MQVSWSGCGSSSGAGKVQCTSTVELGPPAAANSLAAEQARSKVPASGDEKLAEEDGCYLTMHTCRIDRSILEGNLGERKAHSITTCLEDLPACEYGKYCEEDG